MNINSLNPSDVYQIFYNGIDTDYHTLASTFNLNPSECKILSDYIESYLENETIVSINTLLDYLKDKACTFLFGLSIDGFSFKCEADLNNFESGVFSCGGFTMVLPNDLRKIDVGNHVFFFGVCGEISFRFVF